MTTIRVIVRGDSMWPTFSDGDEILCAKLSAEVLRVGDVVVAVHPLQSSVRVLKRIAAITQDNRYLLTGDNPDPMASEDGHNFGPVDLQNIIGYLRS